MTYKACEILRRILYTILKRGLKSFGLGTSLVDLKHKAFRSEALVSAS